MRLVARKGTRLIQKGLRATMHMRQVIDMTRSPDPVHRKGSSTPELPDPDDGDAP